MGIHTQGNLIDEFTVNDQYRWQNSLAVSAIKSLALPISLAIVAITLLAYLYFYSLVKQQHLEKIALFSKERVNYEFGIFQMAEDNLSTASEHLDRQLAAIDTERAAAHFDQLTEHLLDGTYRSPMEGFNSFTTPQILITGNARITDQLARTLSAATRVLSSDGPAWRNRFPNLYFVGREDYAVIYWAGENVVHNMDSGFTLMDKSFYLIGTPAQNPARVNRWTSVYKSISGLNKWMVSSIKPVYQGDIFLGILGQDIYLDNLMTRAIEDHPEGAINMLITQGGELIAHPDYMTQITAGEKGFDINREGDNNLKTIYGLVRSIDAEANLNRTGQATILQTRVIEDSVHERYLVATAMAGMDWILVTEYPKQLISQLAIASSRTALILGAALLLIELLVFFIVIRKTIYVPLKGLGDAASKSGSGDRHSTFDRYLNRQDEIGYLARHLIDMQGKVNQQLDQLYNEIKRRKTAENGLTEESRKLQALNENLDQQVKNRTNDLEQEVKRHSLLSAAIDCAAESVMIVNRDFVIEYVNQAFAENSGYQVSEVIGQTPMALNRFGGDLNTPNQIRTALQKGKVWSGKITNRTKEGELRHEEATMSPIRNHAGEVTCYVEVKRDVTEKTELEQQLNSMQKLEAIGQLAAGIAHEINTPTQFIGDNTRFLKDAYEDFADLLNRLKSLPAKQQKAFIDKALDETDMDYLAQEIPGAIQQSLEGVKRITGIVCAMKEFAHPAKEKVLTEVNRIVQNTITVTMSEWRYVAQMKTDFAADLPPVDCDQGEINQVLLNIIVNAAQAIEEKHDQDVKGLICVRTRYDNGYVAISVSDNGSGMSDQVKARIFDPFFTTKEIGKGIGQGLNMAHKVVVNHHRGKINVASKPGEGSQFTIFLPTAYQENRQTCQSSINS